MDSGDCKTMKKKFRLKNEIENLVKKYKTLSPSELKHHILVDFNKDMTAESIIMFFKRNPEIKKALELELTDNAQSLVEVNTDIFQNGVWENLPSIKKWNIEKATLVSASYQKGNTDAIRRVCQGIYFLKDKHTKKLTEQRIDGWSIKTPERLTLEQAKEFLSVIHGKTGTKTYRLALRDFFLSRDGKTIKPSDISGDMPRLGKWKHAFANKAEITAILEYVKAKNYKAFVADLFMLKTGTRSTATFECCLKSNLHNIEGTNLLSITDKGFHRKGRSQKDKILSPDLLEHLNVLWQSGNNAFAGLDEQALRDLNKEAYRAILEPNSQVLELALAEPNHFWRHMFAQHMLRATNWNYDAVAFLGGWDGTDMLKKVYGAPPEAMLRSLGVQFIPQI